MINREMRRFFEQLDLLVEGHGPAVDGSRLARDVYASFVADFGTEAKEFLAAAAQEENLPLLVH